MAVVIGWIIVICLLGAGIYFVAHVIESARAAGTLPAAKDKNAPKGATGGKDAPGGHPKLPRAQRARTAAVHGGHTVRVIAAQAMADNWLAKRAHRREHGPEAQSRRPLMRRILVPTEPAAGNGAAVAAPAVTPPPQPAPPSPQRPRLAAVPDPVPVRVPQEGPPMTTGTTAHPPANGSAAADLMSAVHRVTTEAQAGGIRSKVSAHLAMGAGFEQQAAALEQHARALSETGQYPPMVWEPVMQAAGMMRAAAGKMGESGNAVAHIAKTPAGELVGMAPAREELHRA